MTKKRSHRITRPKKDRDEIYLWIAASALVIVLGFYVFKYMESERNDTPNPNVLGDVINTPPRREGVEFEALPKDFPQDLILIPGVFDASSRYIDDEGREVIALEQTTFTNFTDTITFFELVLEGSGWSFNEIEGTEFQYSATKIGELGAEFIFEKVDDETTRVYTYYYVPQ